MSDVNRWMRGDTGVLSWPVSRQAFDDLCAAMSYTEEPERCMVLPSDLAARKQALAELATLHWACAHSNSKRFPRWLRRMRRRAGLNPYSIAPLPS